MCFRISQVKAVTWFFSLNQLSSLCTYKCWQAVLSLYFFFFSFLYFSQSSTAKKTTKQTKKPPQKNNKKNLQYTCWDSSSSSGFFWGGTGPLFSVLGPALTLFLLQAPFQVCLASPWVRHTNLCLMTLCSFPFSQKSHLCQMTEEKPSSSGLGTSPMTSHCLRNWRKTCNPTLVSLKNNLMKHHFTGTSQRLMR